MSGKEIARWSNDEVYALLQAWREGLELEPEPLRRGKLNGFVSRRFHELRAHQQPVRTACSIVYKKKYWRSMVQFICEYNLQTPNGDWYALGLAQRKAIFEQRKKTSYKFTDLDQHAAYEIAKLITLEDGTHGLADLVYGPNGQSAAAAGPSGSNSDSDSDSSSAWPLRRATAPAGAAADAAALSHLRHSERKRPAVQYHGASSSDEDDDGMSEDDDNDTFDGDETSEPEFRPRSTKSRSATSILRPVAPTQPPRPLRLELTRSPDKYDDDDVDTRSSASSAESELQTVVSRLEQQTQELKTLVQEERDARTRAQALEEQQTRVRLEQTERRARLLEALERTQRAAVDDANARREEREHWATILEQLQLDRDELERDQVARTDEHARRQTVLREIEQSQLERIQMLDEWAADRSERAAVLEKLKTKRSSRTLESAGDKTPVNKAASGVAIDQVDGERHGASPTAASPTATSPDPLRLKRSRHDGANASDDDSDDEDASPATRMRRS